MYQLDWARQRTRRTAESDAPDSPRISRTVWLLGITSCVTDISSEMINAILPLYLVGYLRLNPLQFGIIDGLYQGVSAVVRIAGGVVADRWRRHKAAAAAGYGLSAVCKLGLLAVGNSWAAIAGVVVLDRTGKGLRTAPRDAMIALSSDKRILGASFGLHRALDALGAMLGPVVAFLVLARVADGYDIIFLASFCLAVIGVSVLVLFVEPPAILPQSTRRAASAARVTVLPILRHREFAWLVVAASGLALATMSDAFVYLTLQQRLGFAPTMFPLLYVATSLVYVVAAAPVGRLADRVGARRVFLAGYLMLGFVYVTLVLPGAGLTGAVAGIAAFGLYYAATDGILATIAAKLLPAERCATGLAVLTTCTNVARFASSIAFGGMWMAVDVTTAVRVFGVALISAIAVAAWIFSRVTPGAATHPTLES